MFIEILLAIVLGVASGIFTGLIPGIHVNLVSALLLVIAPSLLNITSPIVLACFIVALATTHSFIDFIPSTFLGVPDSGTELAVLPAHKMTMQGKGKQAIFCSLIGSSFSLILAAALIPLLLVLLPRTYPFVAEHMGFLLLMLVSFIILKDHSPLKSLFFFLISGLLGLFTLNIPTLNNALFPLLSGMFGVGILISSLQIKNSFPKQSNSPYSFPTKDLIPPIIAATSAGSFTGIFPGLGAAQGAALTQSVYESKNDESYLVLVGGINTANFCVSLACLYAINKARNGAVVAISEILTMSPSALWILVGAGLIAGALSIPLSFKLTNQFTRLIEKVPYKPLVLSVIGFIILICIILSSWQGLIVLATSTALGLIASSTGVAKHHLMGCLILPVLGFFLF